MTFIERIKYYAKAVATIVGGLVTFLGIVIAATEDGAVNATEISTLVGGLVAYITTIVTVIKVENKKPAYIKYENR